MNTTRRPRRPAGTRNFAVQSDVEGAFSSARDDMTDLKQEIEDWKDNLGGNNMEHLPKYEEVSECYDALDSGVSTLEGIEVPEVLQGYAANYTIDTRQSAQSRNGRMADAMNALDAAKSACEARLEENEALEADEAEDFDGDPDAFITEEMVDEREAQRTEVEEFQTELENAYGELENVSFPGMY